MKYHSLLLGLLLAGTAVAKVDLVTLPNRDRVQLTIYNSADLTLVREARNLTLIQGLNRLQFSWAETLIDPTSLSMEALANQAQIEVFDLTYPPRTRNLGLWNIRSGIGGKNPFEITYFTSGIRWRAFYNGTLTPDEKTMQLQAYVLVTNNSGEDYENAETRLIVGKVHILDQIAQLAQQQYPYGRPGAVPPPGPPMPSAASAPMEVRSKSRAAEVFKKLDGGRPKEIKKEGLSEYFLYTIEGTETIPTGWGKRLRSFDVAAVPVVNLYKYEEERWGAQPVRFLNFKNDKEHQLGDTPIPDGSIQVCRNVDNAAHLSYEGASSFKYIPVGENVELNLGPVVNVIVEPRLMEFKTIEFTFEVNGNINGWDEVRTFQVKVKNTREVAVKLELTRNFSTAHWSLTHAAFAGEYQKVDLDTARFKLELAPRSVQEFTYVLTTYHGKREEGR